MQQIKDRLRLLGVGAALSLAALAMGRLSAERPATAIKLVLLPLLVLSVMAPAIPAVMGVGVLPFQVNLLGFGGLQIGASDALLLLAFGGVALALLSGTEFRIGSLAPLVPVVTVYFAALTVAWVNLPSIDGLATIVQRIELIVAAVVVGAYLAHRNQLDRALTAYVMASTLIAIAAIVTVFLLREQPESYLAVQKNPAGQAIANSLLIVLFHRKIPARVPFGAVLAIGLIAAQSRGAILATLIALGLAAGLASSSGRVRVITAVPVIAAVFYAGFSALPTAQQERLINIAPGGDVATETRQNYADDAIAKIKSAPFLGTGLGLYESGSRSDLTYTDDPHNVLLLELAEGGVVMGGAFTLLALSSAWILIRRRGRHPVVIVALAVQVATVLHGVVDVYWVRGTPVMGWVLVGAALHLSLRDGEAEPVPAATSSAGELR